MKQYILYDYSEHFVVLEGVDGEAILGEWHETRFVSVEELV